LNEVNKENILIMYLSRTGNTEAITEIIREEVGGAMVGLELETPYPEDYDAILSEVLLNNSNRYRVNMCWIVSGRCKSFLVQCRYSESTIIDYNCIFQTGFLSRKPNPWNV